MSNALKILGIIVLAGILVAAGVALGVAVRDRVVPVTAQQPAVYGPGDMMRGADGNDRIPPGDSAQRRGGRQGRDGNDRQDGWNRGDQRSGRFGMMGGYVPDADLVPADGQTLTLDQAVKVAEAYLGDYGDDNLEIAEVMQFDNHFYAAIQEKDTGIGAFEILIDPQTAAVHPEQGPNMMWNTKYSVMGGHPGMMGGLRGPRGSSIDKNDPDNDKMTVTPDKARELAQAALDKEMPGVTLAEDAEQFYGYYTIDTLENGEPVGMLSVNGYTGEVWRHTWHGTFVDMTEEGS